jgi:hypothetical protein
MTKYETNDFYGIPISDTIKRTGYNYKPDHRTYGGKIEIEDFNLSQLNKNRIDNQVNAIDLQENLKSKIEDNEKYANKTLEELKELKLISNSDGRPASYLTNEKWQKEFNLRKMFIMPYPNTVKKLKSAYSSESGKWNTDTQGTYHGCTNWQSYCSYINDILSNIQSGQVDYCYYIYQIIDLLKFHYDDLRTKYCDGYWEVWLER